MEGLNKIIIGITGAVAATVMPSYILQLRKLLNVEVTVLVSKNATKFVTPYALSIHSGNEVYTDTFQKNNEVRVPHIKLTKEADLVLIMPATANCIAKIAHGFCDDLISTAVVAAKVPIVMVPSMNARMWFDPIVQQNVKKLIDVGYYIIEPVKGMEVADLSNTFGVMPRLHEIVSALRQILQKGEDHSEDNIVPTTAS